METFKTVENVTIFNKYTSTISAICDEDGIFEIFIIGAGGMQGAMDALKEAASNITPSEL